jgi:hypothetical protein
MEHAMECLIKSATIVLSERAAVIADITQEDAVWTHGRTTKIALHSRIKAIAAIAIKV